MKPIHRIVIKVGSAVITKHDRISDKRLRALVDFLAQLRTRYEVLLVTSGAIATGHAILPDISNRTTPGKQALAAVGQAALIHKYQKAFRPHRIPVAQILITADDFENFRHAENARAAVETLLQHGALLIFNENDAVVVDEIVRGDNDQLSARIAHFANADLLVILSDIVGYFDKDPNRHPDATLRKVVHRIDACELENAPSPNDPFATGGILTKLKAADFLLSHGRQMLLTSGFDLRFARAFLLESTHDAGTLFTPEE